MAAELTKDELSFLETSKQVQMRDQEQRKTLSPDVVARVRSLASAPVKGAVRYPREYIDALSNAVFPIVSGVTETVDRSLNQLGLPMDLGRLLGVAEKSVSSPPGSEEFLNSLLPTEDRPLERGLERGGRLALQLALSGGSPREVLEGVVGGALAGQTAEELKFGPLGQTLAEAAGSMAPTVVRSLGKTIPLTEKQKDLGGFMRRQGFTEEEIAPILQSQEKGSAISAKIARKGARAAKTSSSIKTRVDATLEGLEARPEGASKTPTQLFKQVVSDTEQLMQQKLSKPARDLIREDFDIWKNGPQTAASSINFWRKLNDVYGKQFSDKLGLFKPHLEKVIRGADNALAEDFLLTNELFRKSLTARRLLKANDYEGLIALGEIGQGITGIINGDIVTLGAVFGTVAAREIARELVINPRLINLSNRLASSISKGQVITSSKLVEQIALELDTVAPEAAARISDADIKNVFGSKKEKQEK